MVSIGSGCRLRTAGAALAIALAVGGAHPASACDAASGSGCPLQLSPKRLDALISSDPTRGRTESRLNDKAWISDDWSVVPFALSPPSESNVTMRTSMGHWSAYTSRSISKKIEAAKAMAPESLKLPAPPVVPEYKLDVWSAVDLHGLDRDTAIARSELGADYKITKNSVAGVAAQFGGNENVTGSNNDYMLSTYFGVRPLKPITLDASAAWGEKAATAIDENAVSERSVVTARARGEWQVEKVNIVPELSLSHAEETVSGPTGDGATEKSTLTFAPRLSRKFELKDGEKIEPFVTYKNEINVGAPDLAAGDKEWEAQSSIGAGIGFTKPDSYSLDVSTDVTDLEADKPTEVKSKLQLKLPIN
jgi:hypothetical protein